MGFRLFWWKSKGPGRSQIPANLQRLIAEMAAANRMWGEERIAAELLVKVGIYVSPQTGPTVYALPYAASTEAWVADVALVRNHAKSVRACDFFVAVTATFRIVTCLWSLTLALLECDGPSHRGLDCATVPNDHFWRSAASVHHPRLRQYLLGGCGSCVGGDRSVWIL